MSRENAEAAFSRFTTEHPCPHCGGQAVELMQEVKAQAGKEPSTGFFSLCHGCGAQGPRQDSLEGVLEAHIELPNLREAVKRIETAIHRLVHRLEPSPGADKD